MKDFYLLNVAAVDTRKALTKQFRSMAYVAVSCYFFLKIFFTI